ncbi:MAG: recombinase family protein [Emcibacter sp.]|nr:recombinase family protein [Emcibacter sp.]
MIKVAIYARYSSEMQSESSLTDQIRVCQDFAGRNSWQVVQIFKDRAQTGSNMLRHGLQNMLEEVRHGEFDIVIAEALDRFSRDQADIATIYKELSFNDVKLHTIAEGHINELHIGLTGTMNALFLKSLRQKVKRGLSGRINEGKSAGGNSYGYEVVRQFDTNGEPIRGDRKIILEQAEIVRRIFREYNEGLSPRAIAIKLNEENIPCPSSKKGWSQSTINGNRRRGTGILNNELYIGSLVWNRLRYIKDPTTGKRISRLNPENEWQHQEVPELRIIDQETWDHVKLRQSHLPASQKDFQQSKRPTYLTTGIAKCGCCGSSYVMANQTKLTCARAKDRGTCSNNRKIARIELEEMILGTLKTYLLDGELCEEFSRAYIENLNTLRINHNAQRASYEAELKRIDASDDRILKAVIEGYANDRMKHVMNGNQIRKDELKALLENAEEAPVLIHPNMAGRYKQQITDLIKSFHDKSNSKHIAELLRSLIDKIVLTPDEKNPDGNKNALKIDLYGDLAGILSLASNGDKSLILKNLSHNENQLVAGVGFEPTTFRL